MTFTLTLEHLHHIFDETAKGNWIPFKEAIDPNVHWWINSDIEDPISKSGIYVCLINIFPNPIFFSFSNGLSESSAMD